jgi:hypothetical protein
MFSNCVNLTGSIEAFISAHSALLTDHGLMFENCTAMSDYDTATARYPTWTTANDR